MKEKLTIILITIMSLLNAQVYDHDYISQSVRLVLKKAPTDTIQLGEVYFKSDVFPHNIAQGAIIGYEGNEKIKYKYKKIDYLELKDKNGNVRKFIPYHKILDRYNLKVSFIIDKNILCELKILGNLSWIQFHIYTIRDYHYNLHTFNDIFIKGAEKVKYSYRSLHLDDLRAIVSKYPELVEKINDETDDLELFKEYNRLESLSE